MLTDAMYKYLLQKSQIILAIFVHLTITNERTDLEKNTYSVILSIIKPLTWCITN